MKNIYTQTRKSQYLIFLSTSKYRIEELEETTINENRLSYMVKVFTKV